MTEPLKLRLSVKYIPAPVFTWNKDGKVIGQEVSIKYSAQSKWEKMPKEMWVHRRLTLEMVEPITIRQSQT